MSVSESFFNVPVKQVRRKTTDNFEYTEKILIQIGLSHELTPKGWAPLNIASFSFQAWPQLTIREFFLLREFNQSQAFKMSCADAGREQLI